MSNNSKRGKQTNKTQFEILNFAIVMIKVDFKGKSTYEVMDQGEGIFHINGRSFKPDILKLSPTSYHVINNGKSYNVVLIHREGNFLKLQINGNQYEMNVMDKQALLLKSMGIDFADTNKVDNIKAPMPGLVLQVLIEEGMVVTKGTPLLILEAMKMENVIKSPGDGTVSHIKVKIKDTVDKGMVLIEFK